MGAKEVGILTRSPFSPCDPFGPVTPSKPLSPWATTDERYMVCLKFHCTFSRVCSPVAVKHLVVCWFI